MYAQAEIGEDYPSRGKVHPGRLARRIIIALIVGFLAGAAIMLQVKGWGSLISEAGGSCGSGGNGFSRGACPRGITPALITSFVVGMVAVPAALILLFRKGWAPRAAVVIGVVPGLLAGQSLFGVWHGSDLQVAWVAPFDSTSDLTTVGAWTSGGSLIRVRVDEVISYNATTGAQQWTLAIPGTDVACALSGLGGGTGGESGTGLILYGANDTTCDHLMAVDLATGRQLWASALPSQDDGVSEGAQLAVAGGTAVALTNDGPVGFSVSSGTRLWGPVHVAECNIRELAGSGTSLVGLGSCFTGSGPDDTYDVLGLSPATGKTVWDRHVTEPSVNYSAQILSVSPLIIGEDGSGPRGSTMVRVLGPDGSQTAEFRVDGITVAGTPVALGVRRNDGFGSSVVVAGGVLVGILAPSAHDGLVAYRISDGQRLWVAPTPDEVHDITVSGGNLAFVDESDPAYSLETADLATGKLRSLGFFSQGTLQADGSALYAIGGGYLILNQQGDSSSQPPVAAIRPPAAKS